jgi:hypothetical protein
MYKQMEVKESEISAVGVNIVSKVSPTGHLSGYSCRL